MDRRACASEDGVEVLFRGEGGVCVVMCWWEMIFDWLVEGMDRLRILGFSDEYARLMKICWVKNYGKMEWMVVSGHYFSLAFMQVSDEDEG